MNDDERELKLYEKIWDRLAQEIQLINQRLLWFFTIQGFLFTAFAFSLSAQATVVVRHRETNASIAAQPLAQTMVRDLDPEFFTHRIRIVRRGLAFVGVASAAATVVGVMAARAALRGLQKFWWSRPDSLKFKLVLPQFQRPDAGATGRGIFNAISLPVIVSLAWCYISQDIWVLIATIIIFAGTALDARRRLRQSDELFVELQPTASAV